MFASQEEEAGTIDYIENIDSLIGFDDIDSNLRFLKIPKLW